MRPPPSLTCQTLGRITRPGARKEALPMTAQPKAAPAEPVLLSSSADGVLSLTMNRAPQRNALSIALMTALEEALDAAAKDSTTRVVVISGAGPGFCAGHDLKELRANPGEEFY